MKIKNTTVTVSALLLAGFGAHAQNLFVGDYGSESILKYSGGTPSTFATGMNYPTGLAFDGSGDLFEGDQFSGHIYEWVGAGTTRTTFASGLNQPGPMTFNTAGDLFVVVNGEVDEFNSVGTIINSITDFAVAQGLAFDTAGNLYVSDSGTGEITKIAPGGAQSIFASGLNYPVGMAFNAVGDLFVANGNQADTITEITPGGSQSLFASGLNNPDAIAFDKAGDMFVADGGVGNGNGDITEFAPNSTENVFASGLKPTSLAFQGEMLPVPEPSEFVLFGIGLMGLAMCSRKKEKTA